MRFSSSESIIETSIRKGDEEHGMRFVIQITIKKL
jgi:hypothetical protein